MDVRPSKKRKLSPPGAYANGIDSDANDGASSDGASSMDSFWFDTETNPSSQGRESSTSQPVNGSLADTNGLGDGVAHEPDSIDGDTSELAEEDSSDEDSPSATASLRSAFQMQCDELVENISPKNNPEEKREEKLISKIKSVIKQASAHEPLPVEQAVSRFSKSHSVKIPFPRPRPSSDAKYGLGYSKPTGVTTVGSYALRTTVTLENRRTIDMVVSMPSNLFTEKDYLNNRYFHKRAYYLACIAAAIEESTEIGCKPVFEFDHGNRLQPVLRLQMLPDHGTKLEARIMLSPPDDVFPSQKLLPHRNCVRPKDSEDKGDNQLPPTPFYNASIRSDASILAFHNLCTSARSSCPGYRKACLLGRVWLRQRGFSGTIQGGGIGAFEWSAILALLLIRQIGADTKSVLLPTYSSNQLFRAMLQFFSFKDMANRPVVFGATMKNLASSDGNPILFDAVNSLNLLFKMTPWSYKTLRQEAQATLQTLNTTGADQFDNTFIVKVDEPLMRFDFLFRISVQDLGLNTKTKGVDEELLDKAHKISKVLAKGLGNRVKHFTLRLPPSESWNIKSEPLNTPGDGFMTIGVVADIENMSRTVDRGPIAEERVEGEGFRKFWGGKPELRRFKDGQIQEAIIWSSSRPLNLFHEIIAHLFRTHLGEQAGRAVQSIDPKLESVWSDFNPSREASEALLEQYKILERDIRRLEGLPLQISQIRPAHPLLSCDVVGDNYAHSNKSADVVIDFEGSARWPEDLTAVQITKIAFLVKMGELLEQSMPTVRARVGLENESANVVNKAFLEVQYASSDVSFHLRIHHERERNLIDGLLNSKVTTPAERQVAASALAYNKRTFEKRPMHTQAMQIACTRFPLLSPTIRLMKRWFNTQLLSLYFPSELVETFVVRIFVRPSPWLAPPSSPVTGLLRTLLFLSMWDWQTDPLIVDFSSSMTSGDHAAMNTRFDAWRKLDPHLNRVALFVATNFDPDGSTWTEYQPSKAIAARMTALAKAATNAVRSKGLGLGLSVLFKPSLKDYDFVINLQSSFVPGSSARDRSAAKSKYKNLASNGTSTNFSERETFVHGYIAELRSLYGEEDGDPTMMLFYDTAGGNYIAGVWGPHTGATNGKKKWKINLGHSSAPTLMNRSGKDHPNGGAVNGDVQGEDGENVAARYVANKPAILAEVARLGGDLVHSVQILKAEDES